MHKSVHAHFQHAHLWHISQELCLQIFPFAWRATETWRWRKRDFKVSVKQEAENQWRIATEVESELCPEPQTVTEKRK